MAVSHIQNKRGFTPQPGGGGSKKGKPQQLWPKWTKVAADAIWIRKKVTIDAILLDRKNFPTDEHLRAAMESLFPGFWEWCEKVRAPTKSTKWHLLNNRPYKMYYSGTSDKGRVHDPRSRATMSKEHWFNWRTEEFDKLHQEIIELGIPIPDWKERFRC